jgi:hypothetical protein
MASKGDIVLYGLTDQDRSLILLRGFVACTSSSTARPRTTSVRRARAPPTPLVRSGLSLSGPRAAGEEVGYECPRYPWPRADRK